MPVSKLGPLDTYWREIGAGDQSAVFVHCSLASARALEPLMNELSGSRRMLAFDLPGHGGTAPPVDGTDIQDQALAVLVDLIETHAQGPVDLVGHSFGATVCARLATERPDMVRSLTLFEPVFMSILSDLGWPEFQAEIELTKDFYKALADQDWMTAATSFITRWGMPGEWEKMPQAGREKVAQRMYLVALNNKAVIETGPDRMTAQDLHRISCPTGVAHGAESPNVMTAISRAVTATIEGATATEVAGAGHMLAITHVSPCAEIVRSVWAR